jgi:hypothetical protein
MFHLWPFLLEYPIPCALQGALTIWMLVDAQRRQVDYFWYWIILLLQPFGAWAYFAVYKVRDWNFSAGWLTGLLHRPPSLEELRHRVHRFPTVANRMELGARLIDQRAYEEALPHVESMLAREPDHCQALLLAAECHRGLGRYEQAIAQLERVVARQPSMNNYQPLRKLLEVRQQAGDSAGALAACRHLARIAPILEHRYQLAELLDAAGEKNEAAKILETGLDDFRYLSGASRRRDRRWVGKARQLLKELAEG